jgi:hypothetical protein
MRRNINSVQNALRHGLASKLALRNQRLEIEILARLMCGTHNSVLLAEKAVTVAECDVAISEIRRYKNRLLMRLQDPEASATMHATKEREHRFEQHDRRSAIGKSLVAAFVGPDASKEAAAEFDRLVEDYWSVEPNRLPDDVWAEALPELLRISRYERRAWSRRKRAFMDYLLVLSDLPATVPPTVQ